MQTKQLHYSLLVIIVTVLISATLYFTRPDKKPQQRPAAIVSVAAMTLTRQDIQPAVEVTGRLQPAHKAALKFEVTGRVANRHTEPGRLVNTGDILLELERADYDAALTQARARLEMEQAGIQRDRRLLKIARDDYAIQQKEVTRLQDLGNQSLVSTSRLDQSRQRLLQLDAEAARLEYQVNTASSRLAVNQAATALAQRQLDRTQLRAPFAGTINEVSVQAGDFVMQNQKVIEIIDIDNMDLYVEVAGEVATTLPLGKNVDVMVDGKGHQGEVIAVQKDPNPNTFTHALRIRLAGAGMVSGSLARVELPLTRLTQVYVVPASAILRDEGKNYVFALRQQQLQRIPVQLRLRHGDGWVIDGELQDQELLVARDVAALTDGQQALAAP